MLPTIWPSIDIATTALFMTDHGVHTYLSPLPISIINKYTPAVFRIGLLVAAIGLAFSYFGKARFKKWSLPLAFFVLAGVFGPGLVVNAGFKDTWERARPYQVSEFGGDRNFTAAFVPAEQCSENCSFVSGHVACGAFIASLMLVAPRRKYQWAVAGILASVIIGFARVSVGDHWLSDTVWAVPVTLLSSWLVWQVLHRTMTKQPSWTRAAGKG